MRNLLIAIAISLLVGIAGASWMYSTVRPDSTAAANDAVPLSFDTALPVAERIAALEQAMSDERQARQLLQEEVFYLTGELEQISARDDSARQLEAQANDQEEAADDTRSARRDAYRRRNSPEGRIERLIEAGFQPSEASRIVQRESELQMDALQARYEAERNGEPIDFFRSRGAAGDALRQELGDDGYERYLTANGRSTSIAVSNVIDSSPAQSAGLRPGDEITRYDGARVFTMSDLTQKTLDGLAGQNVVVDIVRDGVPMQVVLPRGPVGISGGRRRR